MAGILVKGLKSYNYEKAVKGSSFIRLYDNNGFCFKSFLDITSAGFADYFNYELTKDTAGIVGKTYYVRSGEEGNYSFTATENFSTNNYELVNINEYPLVAGVGTVAANVGSLKNKVLDLSLSKGNYVQDALQINFKTPVKSSEISAINVEGVEYELVDSHLYNISTYENAFEAESIVSVIINMEDKKAFVQNLKFSSKLLLLNGENQAEELWINPDGSGLKVDNIVSADSKNLITSSAVYEAISDIEIPESEKIPEFSGSSTGLVPSSDGNENKYLSADGSWKTIEMPELPKIHIDNNEPTDNNVLLWIDTTEDTGGLKYYNGTGWVHVPVAYT